jgi:hypothetical protein
MGNYQVRFLEGKAPERGLTYSIFHLTVASCNPLTLIYYNMIEIEQWGKMIIWLWSRYIKKKPIPYIDLEFHYPMWMFYLVGGILGGLILGIALFYFTIIN